MKNIFLLATMLLAIHNYAQTNANPDTRPIIDIIGYAEMDVIPDEIYLRIVLREYMDNKVKVSIAQMEQDMVTRLKSAGLNVADLVMSDASGTYVRVRWNEKDLLTSKDYSLKVATAEQAGKVFQALEDVKHVQVSIARVWHSKMEELKADVHKKAIRNAKEKATYLLAELNKKCGDPVYITETTVNKTANLNGLDANFGNVRYLQSNDYSGDKLGLSSATIQFEKMKITYSLSVSFLIV